MGWYSDFDTSKPLQQGVVLFDFRYLDIPSITEEYLSGEAEGDIVTSDVVILTQSCELVNEKSRHIHVCPLVTFSVVLEEAKALAEARGENYTEKARKKLFESLKRGEWVDRHLFEICKSRIGGGRFYGEYLIAMLDQAFVVSNAYVKSQIIERKHTLMINPPYREALEQTYGLYFMRVGSPDNVTPYAPGTDLHPSK